MKKIFFPIAITIIVIGTSCNKDYLDVKPTSSITAGNFYQSQQDIQQAVTGVYSSLRDCCSKDSFKERSTENC
jgi:starch-binding outer membrane protein, SusD/RagB family